MRYVPWEYMLAMKAKDVSVISCWESIRVGAGLGSSRLPLWFSHRPSVMNGLSPSRQTRLRFFEARAQSSYGKKLALPNRQGRFLPTEYSVLNRPC